MEMTAANVNGVRLLLLHSAAFVDSLKKGFALIAYSCNNNNNVLMVFSYFIYSYCY